MRRFLACATFLAALLGCGGEVSSDSGDDVVFSVAPLELASGDPLVATVVNRSGDSVTVDYCRLVVERRDGVSWAPAEPERLGSPSSLCGIAPVVMAGGETHRQVAPIPVALPPGRYRLRVELRRGAAVDTLTSPGFRVRA